MRVDVWVWTATSQQRVFRFFKRVMPRKHVVYSHRVWRITYTTSLIVTHDCIWKGTPHPSSSHFQRCVWICFISGHTGYSEQEFPRTIYWLWHYCRRSRCFDLACVLYLFLRMILYSTIVSYHTFNDLSLSHAPPLPPSKTQSPYTHFGWKRLKKGELSGQHIV